MCVFPYATHPLALTPPPRTSTETNEIKKSILSLIFYMYIYFEPTLRVGVTQNLQYRKMVEPKNLSGNVEYV